VADYDLEVPAYHPAKDLDAGIKSSAFGDNPTIKSLFSLKQPSVAIMCRCGLKLNIYI
jgi:hypothetical protein